MNRLNIPFSWILALPLALLIACEPETAMDGRSIRQGINDRKIKRISEAQVMDFSHKLGAALCDTLSRSVVGLKQGSCSPQFAEAITRLDQTYGVKALRLGLDDTLSVSAKEQGILTAFAYDLGQNRLPAAGNVQKLTNDTLLYNAVIVAQSSCSPCHKTGEALGFWSVRMPKKEAIRNFNPKF